MRRLMLRQLGRFLEGPQAAVERARMGTVSIVFAIGIVGMIDFIVVAVVRVVIRVVVAERQVKWSG